MKKKGFTLVEVLAVIIILSVLIVIVAPIINNSSNSTKYKSYETKISLIENAAVLYGQDNYRTIINNAKAGKPNYSVKTESGITYYNYVIQIINLEDYLTKEKEDCVVTDPRNNTCLENNKVEITINPNTKKVTAIYIETT